jgi:hypothetical protein
MKTYRRSTLLMAMLVMLASVSWQPATSQNKSKSEKTSAELTGTPVLMHDDLKPESLDLFYGPGGKDTAPDLSSVTFLEEEKSGWSKKYRVQDGSSQVWVAKLSKEAQSETAASRIVWAAGYYTDISYLVPRLEIKGKGVFENVRLEARPKGMKRLEPWQWEANPFVGTREFQGLKVLMVLVNNWDMKDENNRIISIKNAESGERELRYIVSDLGATLGKLGGMISRSRNKPEDFINAKFIKEVEGGKVRFNYSGKNPEIFRDITIEQAQWIGERLSRLSDAQLSDAFRAANYSPDEISAMTQATRGRINQLVNVTQTAQR